MPPAALPRASVVVVADGPWDDTIRCLAAVARGAAGVDHEVIVVDDGTTDETAAALPRLPGITTLRGDQPQGFHAAAAAGVGVARAPLVVLLHADAEPHPGWLAPLVALGEGDEAVAAAASRLVAPSGLVEGDGVIFSYGAPYPMTPMPVDAGVPAIPSEEVSVVPAATAVSLMVRRERFEAVGGFDPAYQGPAGDLDLCLRLAAAGGLVLVARGSVALHHGRCGGEISDGDAARLTRSWLGRVPLLDPTGRASLPAPAPAEGRGPVSAVVPFRDALASLAPCATSVLRNLAAGDELVLADGGSEDGSLQYARLLEREHVGRVRVIEAGGWGAEEEALRRGLEAARHPDALLVGPGLEVPDGALSRLAGLRGDDRGAPAVAVALPGAGPCVLAPLPLLGDLAAATPGACLGGDAGVLSAAIQAHGGRLILAPPGGGA